MSKSLGEKLLMAAAAIVAEIATTYVASGHKSKTNNNKNLKPRRNRKRNR